MKIKSLFALVALLTVLAMSGLAQDLPKVYIAPMDNGFADFLTSALIKEKVPITIVATDESADYVIVGSAIKGNNKWYDTVFGSEKDRNQASIRMLKSSDKSIVWAGSAGDKSFWTTAWSKGGQRKVADKLAKSLKKEYFNQKRK